MTFAQKVSISKARILGPSATPYMNMGQPGLPLKANREYGTV